MDEFSRDDYRRLTTLAYAAALDPGLWPDLLTAMTEVIRGLRTHMITRQPGRAKPLATRAAGYDPALLAGYAEGAGRQNPWTPAALAAPTGRVLFDDQLCPADRLRRTAFHADWLAPQGLSGVAGVVIASSRYRWCFLGGNLTQARHQEDMPRLVHLLEELAPHLQQSLEIARRLEGAALGGPAGAAVMLLGQDQRPVWLNDQAEAWLSAGNTLHEMPDGRVRPVDPMAAALLRQFAGRLGRSDAPRRLRLANGAEMRLGWLFPEALAELEGALLTRPESPLVLVTLTAAAPAAPDLTLATRLATRHGLTAAEIGVTLSLIEGATIREIAERRAVSIHTVRNQVKAILGKTGCRRQADLLRSFAADAC